MVYKVEKHCQINSCSREEAAVESIATREQSLMSSELPFGTQLSFYKEKNVLNVNAHW